MAKHRSCVRRKAVTIGARVAYNHQSVRRSRWVTDARVSLTLSSTIWNSSGHVRASCSDTSSKSMIQRDCRILGSLLSTAPPIYGLMRSAFRGSFAMEEVVFFHRLSRTAIFCDLIQRHPRTKMSGWKGLLMQLDSLVGEQGSTPREWRASFLRRSPARSARETVIGWNAEQLLIAHGQCSRTGARRIIEQALAWI